MSEKGTHITLDVSKQSDLRRDVIKSDTASISIPEADLEVTTGIISQAHHPACQQDRTFAPSMHAKCMPAVNASVALRLAVRTTGFI